MAKYYDLDIWKSSRKLALYLHKQVKSFNDNENSELAEDITDYAISLPAIIADAHNKDNEIAKEELIVEANGLLQELEIMLQKASVQFNLKTKTVTDGIDLINECKVGLQMVQQFKFHSPLAQIGNRIYVTPPNNPLS
jgi:four helix bundle protein